MDMMVDVWWRKSHLLDAVMMHEILFDIYLVAVIQIDNSGFDRQKEIYFIQQQVLREEVDAFQDGAIDVIQEITLAR